MRRASILTLSLAFALAAACGRTGIGTSTDDGGGGSTGIGGIDQPACGDGAIALGEECDDANTSNTDACVSGCRNARCGDGFVRQGVEACDDANMTNNDACTNICSLPSCGDGVVDPGEACDDANASNQDGCLSTCLLPFCGDGFVWAGNEICDDGNGSNNDACLLGCVPAACGDGFVWTGVEACDDGNTNNFDGCRNDCALPSCGDGILDPGEACDDGNGNNFDSCRNNCTVPFCGDGIVDPGEGCDDANASNNDACVVGCVPAACGDGFLFFGVEECDDGNLTPGDGCSPLCQLPFCGDGVVEPGEACDLGPLNEDRPALEIEQAGIKQAVVPFDNAQDASIFYNYFSQSGHTGFEAVQTSRMYYYRDTATEILSLFMHHHIDAIASPLTDVDFTIAGLPPTVLVGLSDDTPGEFFKQSATTVVGNWSYQNNTDGGVLSGFPFPGAWTLTVSAGFSFGVTSWEFFDGGVAFSDLSMNDDLILRAYPTPSACRTDCTVPVCGDGILDGGEVCDDGNTVGGDGCAANCSSLGG